MYPRVHDPAVSWLRVLTGFLPDFGHGRPPPYGTPRLGTYPGQDVELKGELVAHRLLKRGESPWDWAGWVG